MPVGLGPGFASAGASIGAGLAGFGQSVGAGLARRGERERYEQAAAEERERRIRALMEVTGKPRSWIETQLDAGRTEEKIIQEARAGEQEAQARAKAESDEFVIGRYSSEVGPVAKKHPGMGGGDRQVVAQAIADPTAANRERANKVVSDWSKQQKGTFLDKNRKALGLTEEESGAMKLGISGLTPSAKERSRRQAQQQGGPDYDFERLVKLGFTEDKAREILAGKPSVTWDQVIAPGPEKQPAEVPSRASLAATFKEEYRRLLQARAEGAGGAMGITPDTTDDELLEMALQNTSKIAEGQRAASADYSTEGKKLEAEIAELRQVVRGLADQVKAALR